MELNVIVKSELIDEIWKNTNKSNEFKKDDIEFIVNTFIKTIIDEIKNDRNIKIEGFGTFSSYIRHSYIGKNPNGYVGKIPDTRYISFKPSNKLKQ